MSWFSDIVGGRRTLLEWVRYCGTLGIDGVDFSVLLLPANGTWDLRELRAEIDRANLQVAMLVCYSDFTIPDEHQRLCQIEDARANIRLAHSLGATILRVTAGQRYPGVTRKRGIAWVQEGLHLILPDADRLGITLAFENHTKGAPWRYWDFSQPSEIFLEILDGMRDTSLGVNFDTANPLVANEDPVSLLEAVKDRVVSVHAADIRAPGALEPVVVGTGVAPIRPCFSILKDRGFDGWICIEEASRTGQSGYEQAVAFVRKTWAEA